MILTGDQSEDTDTPKMIQEFFDSFELLALPEDGRTNFSGFSPTKLSH